MKFRNEKLLKNAPHRDYLDFAIIYRVVIENSADGITSAIITDSLAKSLGLTEEELYISATQNTPKICEVSVTSIEDMLSIPLQR